MKTQTIFYTLILILLIGQYSLLNAQTNVSGQISANTVWTLANNPYIVIGNVLVNNGVTLTIEPGVTVKFDSLLSMEIDGTLLAQGTSSNKITFTSNTTQAAGAWGYVYFSDGSVDATYDGNGNYLSGSILEYCTIQYAGGANVGNNGALRLDGAHPFVNYCTISDNSFTGIHAYNLNSSLKITNSLISNNTSTDVGGGFRISGNSSCNILIKGNTISNNTTTFNWGGGIYFDCQGNSVVSNNIITKNTCSIGGGVVLMVVTLLFLII